MTLQRLLRSDEAGENQRIRGPGLPPTVTVGERRGVTFKVGRRVAQTRLNRRDTSASLVLTRVTQRFADMEVSRSPEVEYDKWNLSFETVLLSKAIIGIIHRSPPCDGGKTSAGLS